MASYVAPYLLEQGDMVDELEARLNDSSNNIWTANQMKQCINRAAETWARRVTVPYLYTLTAGWSVGTYEYSIPSYVPTNAIPQHRVLMPYEGTSAGDTGTFVWQDLMGWDWEPDGSGGQNLRTAYTEGIIGTDNQARLFWYGENGPLPTASLTLNANIDADDTSLVLSAVAYPLGNTGYVKLNSEYMQYAGFTDDGTNTTLQNLVRGVRGTAASHTASDAITFCLALPDLSLQEVLYAQAQAFAHEIQLTGAKNDADRERHQWNMRYHQQRVADFWRGWTGRAVPVRLGRTATYHVGRSPFGPIRGRRNRIWR